MLRHLLLRTLVCLLTLWLALDDQRACGQSHSPPASGCPARCGSPESGLAVNKKQTKTKKQRSQKTQTQLLAAHVFIFKSKSSLDYVSWIFTYVESTQLLYSEQNFIVVLNIPITCLCGPLSELLFSNNCNRLYLPNTGNYSFGQEM